MNLYEAMFSRRSVRNYRHEPVEDITIEQLKQFHKEIVPLFSDINTRIDIIDTIHTKEKISGAFHIKAPYYLAFYSEVKEKYMLNAGYIMQQMSLFLHTKGIASCFLGNAHRKKSKSFEQEDEFVILMAFGKAEGDYKRPEREAKRISLDDLCVYKEQPGSWMKSTLRAARIAPSSMNSQPWRFVVYENRAHIFMKKSKLPVSALSRWGEFDFGIMLAHIMVVAEEIWVDIDLIKLGNISNKIIQNNEYVISAILKP